MLVKAPPAPSCALSYSHHPLLLPSPQPSFSAGGWRRVGFSFLLHRKRKDEIAMLSGSHLPAIRSSIQKEGTPSIDFPHVAIIMGSDSDLPTMTDAAEFLKTFDIPFELTIVSAHWIPDRMHSFTLSASERGIQVTIAGAGGAAHLAGMVASLTPLPVIGVPIKMSSLNGVDSLLSIVQMPKGIPVATVAIGNAANAALFAVRMLASADPDLWDRIIKYQQDLKDVVLIKAEKLKGIGWEAYMNS